MQQIEIICYPHQRMCQTQSDSALHFSYPFALQAIIKISNQGQESCRISLQLIEKVPSESWQHMTMQLSHDKQILFTDSLETLLVQPIALQELPALATQSYLIQFSLRSPVSVLGEQLTPFTLHFDWRWQLDCADGNQQSVSTSVNDQPQVLAASSHPNLNQSTAVSKQSDPIQSDSHVLWFLSFGLLLVVVFVIMKFIHVAWSKKKTNILDKNKSSVQTASSESLSE